ncbi:MAG: ArdC-like ssDNA-binding domain-containing protein [Syntrophobacteraceae bacterium]
MLWAWSLEKGFVAPIWVTFTQAAVPGAHVRKGELAVWSCLPQR